MLLYRKRRLVFFVYISPCRQPCRDPERRVPIVRRVRVVLGIQHHPPYVFLHPLCAVRQEREDLVVSEQQRAGQCGVLAVRGARWGVLVGQPVGLRVEGLAQRRADIGAGVPPGQHPSGNPGEDVHDAPTATALLSRAGYVVPRPPDGAEEQQLAKIKRNGSILEETPTLQAGLRGG